MKKDIERALEAFSDREYEERELDLLVELLKHIHRNKNSLSSTLLSALLSVDSELGITSLSDIRNF